MPALNTSPAPLSRRLEPTPTSRPVATAHDLETLALCLGYCGVREPELLATRLFDDVGGLSAALCASPERLTAIPGMTAQAAGELRGLLDLTVRIARGPLVDRPLITCWTDVLDYVRVALRHETREQFRVLFLDKKNRLITDEVLSVGTVDHAPVYVREVLKRALELSAAALILVHNHPTGDPTPSRQDVEITKRILDAAKPLHIVVHDHLVVGREVASLKALGLL